MDEISKRDNNRVTAMLGVGNDSDLELITLRIDPITKRLLVEALSTVEGNASVGDGTALVTTAGTRVQLPDVACKRVSIQALSDNAGTVVVGGVTVVAAIATRRGFRLFQTQGEWFNVSNLNLLYIDSTQNGDSITYFYEN